jgi:hypothetical protein
VAENKKAEQKPRFLVRREAAGSSAVGTPSTPAFYRKDVTAMRQSGSILNPDG